MRVVIAYESVYGNTRAVADAIANGFPPYDDVTVKTVHELCPDDLVADVLVVGAPTHAHGLPRRASRRAARDLSSTTRPDQRLEPTAQQPGVREWLEQLPPRIDLRVAAFDTRFGLPAWTSGHPARRRARPCLPLG